MLQRAAAEAVPVAKRLQTTVRRVRQRLFEGAACSGGGAASLVSAEGAGCASGCSVEGAGGSSSITFSSGGNGLGLSYSSPGNGRGFALTFGGALFTGTAAPA